MKSLIKSRPARVVAAAVGLGGLALLLSACTITATPTQIPVGTSTGQAVGPITVRYAKATATSAGGATTSLRVTFSITGSGTVAPVPSSVVQSTTTGTVDAPITCFVTTTTTPTTPQLVCPTFGLGTTGGTLTISGVEVNSTAASGKLVASVSQLTIGRRRVSAVVANYVTEADSAPTFRSPASAAFTAGRLSGTWVRLGESAVLSLEGAPSWLSISPHAGYLRGTPPAAAAGHTYKFTVLASTDPRTRRPHGDNLATKQSFTLKVVES